MSSLGKQEGLWLAADCLAGCPARLPVGGHGTRPGRPKAFEGVIFASGGHLVSAYPIVEHIVTDSAKFDAYRTQVAPPIAKYAGRYLTKGGSHRLLETGARCHH